MGSGCCKASKLAKGNFCGGLSSYLHDSDQAPSYFLSLSFDSMLHLQGMVWKEILSLHRHDQYVVSPLLESSTTSQAPIDKHHIQIACTLNQIKE